MEMIPSDEYYHTFPGSSVSKTVISAVMVTSTDTIC